MTPNRSFLTAPLVLVSFAACVFGQGPSVGEDAPSFELEAWAQLGKGEKPPSAETLKGKVVLIEFWGTWCGPCVRAMPRIQALHARYKDRGLKVLGISYETLEVTKPFCEKNGYTFAIGSDPAKRVCSVYVHHGWPTSIVLSKDGKIAHVGNPYSAEEAVEKALGLETDPAKLLTAALEASRIEGREAHQGRSRARRGADAARAGSEGLGGGRPEAARRRAREPQGLRRARGGREARAGLGREGRGEEEGLARPPGAVRAGGVRPGSLGRSAPTARPAPIAKTELAELVKAQRYDEALDALYLARPPAASSRRPRPTRA